MKPLFAFGLFAACAFAQSATAAPAKEVVFYSFHNAQLQPPEYTFQLSRDCDAIYTAQPGKEEPAKADDADAEPDRESKEEKERGERREVRLSPGTCATIFDLAKSVSYFKGDFEFRKHRVAYTGDRVLGYFAPGVSNKTSFTWSEDGRIQQLAATFDGIAATLEYEPKLKYLRRYDRLGLNETLKRLDDQVRAGWLRELQLIAPELKSIAEDPQIMNIARDRARHLLVAAENPLSPPTAKK
jgi:hypothetical protein